jgi:hypothetical protein
VSVSTRLQYYRVLVETNHTVICGICEERIINVDEVTIDHILPKSLGGSNINKNLQAAHSDCNMLRGNMLLVEFKNAEKLRDIVRQAVKVISGECSGTIYKRPTRTFNLENLDTTAIHTDTVKPNRTAFVAFIRVNRYKFLSDTLLRPSKLGHFVCSSNL